MRGCSLLPVGAGSTYRLIQRNVGRADGNPMDRLPVAVRLAKVISRYRPIAGMRMLEIGSGHVPQVPMAFHLLGAGEITTIDKNRRMDAAAVRRLVAFLRTEECAPLLAESRISTAAEIRTRADRISRSQSNQEALDLAGIRYVAPGDAGSTGLPDHSIDCVFSVTTFEHIPPDVLVDIVLETKRILTPTGIAVHLIDPSDHFAHTDSSITRVNFLKYSDQTWNLLAGNQFAYCNRLQASDYAEMFRAANMKVLHWESTVDTRSLELLRRGFRVHSNFTNKSAEDLASMDVLTVTAP